MVNVFEYLQGYYTLTDVLTMFMDKKQSIDMKSAAWMYNRILEAVSHSGPEGIVHGGVHPDNILLHPESHRIVLTGWSSSVQAGEKIKYASETYKQMYPQEVIGDSSKRKAYLATDLFMAAATIWHVLGGDVTSMIEPRGIPGEVRSFLRARLTLDVRLRDAVAIQQRDRFSEVLKSLYGPAKFHPFVLPK
jgi:serine/threonine protein kinase